MVLHIVSFMLFFSEFTKCPQELLYSFKFTIYAVKTLFKPILENHKIVWKVLLPSVKELHLLLFGCGSGYSKQGPVARSMVSAKH